MAISNLLQSWLSSCQILKPSGLKILLRDAGELFVYGFKKIWTLLLILFFYSLSIYYNWQPDKIPFKFSIPIKLFLIVFFIIIMRSHHTTYSLKQYGRDVWRSILWYFVLVGGVLLLIISSSFYSSIAIWIANKCSLFTNETQVVTSVSSILQSIGLCIGLCLFMSSQFILFTILDANAIISDLWDSCKKGICLTIHHLPITLVYCLLALTASMLLNTLFTRIPLTLPGQVVLRVITKYIRLVSSLYWASTCFILYQRSKDISCNQ